MSPRRMVVSRPAGFDTPTPRRLTREWILQHVQPAAQAVSADGVPGPGEADARRAPCARLHVLGAVRRDAILPTRAGPFAAGDLRRATQQRGQAHASGHHRPGPLDAGVCERASAVAALPRRVPGVARALSGAGPASEEVPVQEQAGQPGLDGDRPVRDAVRLGQVSAHQGGGQAPLSAGSRRLPAQRGRHHRGQAP